MALNVKPTEATLGAVVTGLSLARMDQETFIRIQAAWHEHAVLIFPGQHLDDAEHLRFTRWFGELEQGIRSKGTLGISRLSNVASDGTVVSPEDLARRFQRGNMQWHTDSSYKRVGAKASILAAHVVPAVGGQTEWADMRAAYDVLDQEMKAYLDDKIAVHSYRFSHSWHGGLELLDDAELARLPPVEHPVVRIHPDTGRKNLFIGRHASHILGEELESSRELLRELTVAACQSPRTLKHDWTPGDIVIWDNRCVLHRGHEWPDDAARVMVRSTVAGDGASNEWVVPAATA